MPSPYLNVFISTGWIADIHDSYNPVFYMSAAISIFAGLIVFLLQCGRNKISPTSGEEKNLIPKN